MGRSLDRWLSVDERRLAAMRRAADAAGGTVNDMLLAAVAGALASYHRQQGRPFPAGRVTMPISIRRPGDAVGGNRFVPVRFTLPVDDPDPRARVGISGGHARGWRSEPAIGATDLLADGLNRLPGPVVSRLFGSMLRWWTSTWPAFPGSAAPRTWPAPASTGSGPSPRRPAPPSA
jgi:hypothetical protein